MDKNQLPRYGIRFLEQYICHFSLQFSLYTKILLRDTIFPKIPCLLARFFRIGTSSLSKPLFCGDSSSFPYLELQKSSIDTPIHIPFHSRVKPLSRRKKRRATAQPNDIDMICQHNSPSKKRFPKPRSRVFFLILIRYNDLPCNQHGWKS